MSTASDLTRVLDRAGYTVPPASAGGAVGLSTVHSSPFLAQETGGQGPQVSEVEIEYIRAEINRRRSARRAALTRRAETNERKTLYPEGPHALITQGGAVFTLQAPEQPCLMPVGGQRGKIEYLSAASRRRLMRFLASIDLTRTGGYPIFITLTYPGDYPHERAQFKRDLDVFLKRLVRQSPQAAGAWRLEPQARGAPHYHLLVYGVRYLGYDWVAENWFSVVGSGCSDHLLAGTRVEAIRSYNGVLSYAAKYLSKRPDGSAPVDWGKWWGIFNRARLPITTSDIPLTDEQFNILQRTQTRLLAHRGHKMRATLRLTSSTILLTSVQATSLVLYVCNGSTLKEHSGWQHMEAAASRPQDFAPTETSPILHNRAKVEQTRRLKKRALDMQELSRQLWRHYPRPRRFQQTYDQLVNNNSTEGEQASA